MENEIPKELSDNDLLNIAQQFLQSKSGMGRGRAFVEGYKAALRDRMLPLIHKTQKNMNRQDLLDKLQEIQDRNYNTFKGSNEADLMIREEIADLMLPLLGNKPCFYVKNIEDNSVHEIQKYIKGTDGEQHIWCNTWYGHHIIGKSCEFATPIEPKQITTQIKGKEYNPHPQNTKDEAITYNPVTVEPKGEEEAIEAVFLTPHK